MSLLSMSSSLQNGGVTLNRNARKRQTRYVSAVEILFPWSSILQLANVTLALDWEMEVHRRITQYCFGICQRHCLFNDQFFSHARMFKMWSWIFQHWGQLALSKMERVCPLYSVFFSSNTCFIKTNVISTMPKVVTRCLQLYILSSILDVNQEWTELGPQPLMSPAMSWRVTLVLLHPSSHA